MHRDERRDLSGGGVELQSGLTELEVPGELLGGDPEPFSLPWCDELDPPAVAVLKGRLAVFDAPLDPTAVNECTQGVLSKGRRQGLDWTGLDYSGSRTATHQPLSCSM